MSKTSLRLTYRAYQKAAGDWWAEVPAQPLRAAIGTPAALPPTFAALFTQTPVGPADQEYLTLSVPDPQGHYTLLFAYTDEYLQPQLLWVELTPQTALPRPAHETPIFSTLRQVFRDLSQTQDLTQTPLAARRRLIQTLQKTGWLPQLTTNPTASGQPQVQPTPALSAAQYLALTTLLRTYQDATATLSESDRRQVHYQFFDLFYQFLLMLEAQAPQRNTQLPC